MPGNHIDLKQRLYDDLQRLLWAMTWDLANEQRWQLEPDEIFAELCLELVKVAERYGDKPYTEVKSLCVVCCRNRISDLATSNYITHRKVEANTLSLDDDELEIEIGADDAYFDFAEFMSQLSADAQKLVTEVLKPSERACTLYELSCMRKRQVLQTGNWMVSVEPRFMQRVMGWPKFRLNQAWNEVTQAVQALQTV